MSDRVRPPQIPPRGIVPRTQRQPTPMAQRPGRDPQRPYDDQHGSVASLARHLRIGLDLSKLTTEVPTHQLALILDTMIGVGFKGETAERFQTELQSAAQAAIAAQREAAEKGRPDEGDPNAG